MKQYCNTNELLFFILQTKSNNSILGKLIAVQCNAWTIFFWLAHIFLANNNTGVNNCGELGTNVGYLYILYTCPFMLVVSMYKSLVEVGLLL